MPWLQETGWVIAYEPDTKDKRRPQKTGSQVVVSEEMQGSFSGVASVPFRFCSLKQQNSWSFTTKVQAAFLVVHILAASFFRAGESSREGFRVSSAGFLFRAKAKNKVALCKGQK